MVAISSPALRNLVVWLVAASVGQPTFAGPMPEHNAEAARGSVAEEADEQLNDAVQNLGAEGGRPCVIAPPSDQRFLDKLQGGLFKSVCTTAYWFDGLFGRHRFFSEYDRTHGRVGIGLRWDERDEFGADLRFRAKINFPQLGSRFDALIGRGNPDEIITGRNEFETLPSTIGPTEDDRLLVGLGYRPLTNERNRLSFSAGLDLDTPVDPFVRSTYRHNFLFGERSMFRFRQVLFWRETEGVGTTSEPEFNWIFGPRFLFRWDGSATVSEAAEGVEWQTGVTLFHQLRTQRSRALAYVFEARGETDAPVTLQEYGVSVTYRQSVFREWLFLELRTGYAWPKDFPEELRESVLNLGVGFEMFFGQT